MAVVPATSRGGLTDPSELVGADGSITVLGADDFAMENAAGANSFSAADGVVEVGNEALPGTLKVYNAAGSIFDVSPDSITLGRAAGPTIRLNGLTTSDPGSAGRLWNDGGTIKISAG